MHADRFNGLTRIMMTTNSRRRALSLALSGVLGLRGLVQPDDATAGGKCKPKCVECKKCKKGKKGKKGKCKPKSEGTECSTGTCKSGSCVATAAPISCQGKIDGTSCGGGQQCSRGVCATPVGCSNPIF